MYASGLNTDFPGSPISRKPTPTGNGSPSGCSILWTTLLLVGPMVFLMRRWTPPFGSFTLMFGVVGVLMASIFAFEAAARHRPRRGGRAGGRCTGPDRAGRTSQPERVRWTAALTPLVLWSARFVGLAAVGGIGWPPEVWSGTIVFGVLLGLGLALLAFPPRLLLRSASQAAKLGA